MSNMAHKIDVTKTSHDKIVKHYVPMVKRIAHHLMARLPSSVQVDDLIQAGMMGLLEAARKYDKSKGASFETYAGIRIRGNMLDEVRRGDWVPRSVHRNSREVAQVVRDLSNAFGRDVRDHEVAEAMEIDISEYYKRLADANSARLFALDDVCYDGEIMSETTSTDLSDPYECVRRDDFLQNLTDGIENLPERERLVLSLYYDEELNLKEIGAILTVSESRVSQIHSQAMLRLRSSLPDTKD